MPLELLTSGSSGKMLSTSLLYRGLSAPQQPQTPEEDKRWGERRERNKEGEKDGQLAFYSMMDRNAIKTKRKKKQVNTSYFIVPSLL